MNTKETIAFIGDIEKTFPLLLKNLAQMDVRLLLVYKEEDGDAEIGNRLGLKSTMTEIEMIPCAKEGCWEADMIVLVDPNDVQAPLMERIKEVAVQKTVLCISDVKNNKTAFSETQIKQLQHGLPHSKIVQIFIDSEEMSASILGRNKEALETSSEIIENAGFKINLERKLFNGN